MKSIYQCGRKTHTLQRWKYKPTTKYINLSDIIIGIKNHRFARSIEECSWNRFTDYLQYKAESAGCVVVAVSVNTEFKF